MKTARYLNSNIDPNIHAPVRISLGVPKFKLPYEIADAWDFLMPESDMLTVKEYESYKVQYFKLLEYREADKLVRTDYGGKEPVLLCFEDIRKPSLWCHRRMFAEWYEMKIGRVVEELEEADPIQWSKAELKAMRDTSEGRLFE